MAFKTEKRELWKRKEAARGGVRFRFRGGNSSKSKEQEDM